MNIFKNIIDFIFGDKDNTDIKYKPQEHHGGPWHGKRSDDPGIIDLRWLYDKSRGDASYVTIDAEHSQRGIYAKYVIEELPEKEVLTFVGYVKGPWLNRLDT